MTRFLIFVSAFLLQVTLFSQEDTLSTDFSVIPSKILEEYKILTQKIHDDSLDALSHLERAELLAGIDDSFYRLTIIGNQKVFELALSDYNQSILLDPYNFQGYFGRGLLHFRFLDYKKSIAAFDEALNYAWSKEQRSRTIGSRANAKSKMGNHDLAIRDLEKALLVDPESFAVLNVLGLVHMRLKESSKALEYFNRCLATAPDNFPTNVNIALVAIDARKYKKAILIYDKLEADHPKEFIIYSNRGLAKFKLGQLKLAMEDINHSLELFPNNSFALKNRALIHLEWGDEVAACEDLMAAKKLGYTIEHDDEVIKLLFDHCLEYNVKPKN